jgi:hypothetical protein
MGRAAFMAARRVAMTVRMLEGGTGAGPREGVALSRDERFQPTQIAQQQITLDRTQIHAALTMTGANPAGRDALAPQQQPPKTSTLVSIRRVQSALRLHHAADEAECRGVVVVQSQAECTLSRRVNLYGGWFKTEAAEDGSKNTRQYVNAQENPAGAIGYFSVMIPAMAGPPNVAAKTPAAARFSGVDSTDRASSPASAEQELLAFSNDAGRASAATITPAIINTPKALTCRLRRSCIPRRSHAYRQVGRG